jgi:hypothetical protein
MAVVLEEYHAAGCGEARCGHFFDAVHGGVLRAGEGKGRVRENPMIARIGREEHGFRQGGRAGQRVRGTGGRRIIR